MSVDDGELDLEEKPSSKVRNSSQNLGLGLCSSSTSISLMVVAGEERCSNQLSR